jgi:hypothetical protein
LKTRLLRDFQIAHRIAATPTLQISGLKGEGAAGPRWRTPRPGLGRPDGPRSPPPGDSQRTCASQFLGRRKQRTCQRGRNSSGRGSRECSGGQRPPGRQRSGSSRESGAPGDASRRVGGAWRRKSPVGLPEQKRGVEGESMVRRSQPGQRV